MNLAEAARIVREATKDKSYQETPTGAELRRFLDWFRHEVGATERSVNDYESVLKELALAYADLEVSEFEVPAGTQLLRDLFARQWPHAAPNTRRKIRAYCVSFFDYLIEENRLISNPARAMRTPKVRGIERGLIAPKHKQRLLAGQSRMRDTLAVRLLFALALRKGELGAIQFKHFDLARRRLRVFGKGGTVFDVPVPRELCDDVERYMLGHDADEYLLFPEKRGPRIPGGPLETLWADRTKAMSSVALHR